MKNCSISIVSILMYLFSLNALSQYNYWAPKAINQKNNLIGTNILLRNNYRSNNSNFETFHLKKFDEIKPIPGTIAKKIGKGMTLAGGVQILCGLGLLIASEYPKTGETEQLSDGLKYLLFGFGFMGSGLIFTQIGIPLWAIGSHKIKKYQKDHPIEY